MRKLLIVVAALLVTATASAAISFGTADTTWQTVGNCHPCTHAYVADSGSNTVMFMSFTYYDLNTGASDPTVTYNSSSMTKIGVSPTAANNVDESWFYYIKNPPSGSHTVSIDFGASASAGVSMSAVIVTAAGVDQTTSVDTGSLQTNSCVAATTCSVTVTSTAGNVVIQGADVSAKHPTLAGAASHSEIGWTDTTSEEEDNQMTKADGAASTVLTLNWSGAETINMVGIEINAVAGGTATPTRNRFHVGEFVRTPTPSQLATTRWKE